MIERYMKLRAYVNAVIYASAEHRTKSKRYLLEQEEIQIAENMLFVLHPFKVITNMLSHSKLTSSRILPCLVFLKRKLQPEENDKDELKNMKSFMLACLNYYIDSYKMFDNVILITATFLDPELKNFELFDEYTDKSSADFVSIATEYLVKKHDCFKQRVK